MEEQNKKKLDFQKKVKLFTVLMEDIAKKIDSICEENKEDENRFYACYPFEHREDHLQKTLCQP